jgi:nicotinamide mononucleotide transporter
MGFFDIKNIAFEIFGYGLSYIELIGTLFGFISVLLAAKSNVLTWPTGIVNEAAFFILFFQIQLYSDMYLQVYFFGITIYGWYYWKQQREGRSINFLTRKWRLYLLVITIVATIVSGTVIGKIHVIFPDVFNEPAAYPFWDALTTITSIVASILLTRKIIETWFLWILADIISIILYSIKGIYLVAIEYFIFLIICIGGFYSWRKQL